VRGSSDPRPATRTKLPIRLIDLRGLGCGSSVV